MQRLRPQVPRLAALAVIVITGLAMPPPYLRADDADAVRERFAFARHLLEPVAVDGYQDQRTVAPAADRISAWISGVGAAVALADVDGSGRSDDLCHTDPRTDTVTVAPAPTTGSRYEPFALDVAPLPYDRSTMAPMGCLPADFTENGLTDLLLFYWGRSPVLLLRVPESPLGPEAFRPQELVEPFERWYSSTAVAPDLDGDGHRDLVIGNYFQDGARLLDATAHDDPLFEMHESFAHSRNGGRNRAFLWKGAEGGPEPSVGFRDVPDAFPDDTAYAWTLAIGAYDLDGDLLPELYFANDFGPSLLLHNRSSPGEVRLEPVWGRRGLATGKSRVLGRDSFKGMGIDFGDLTGNGHADMFVSNITTERGLMEGNLVWANTGRPGDMAAGRAPFVERSERLGLARSGWAWDVKLGDFDNDGVLEIVQATGFLKGRDDHWPEISELAMANDQVVRHLPSWPRIKPGDDLSGHEDDAFFVRREDGRWASVSELVGLADQGVSRALAVGDVTGNGLLDFAVARQWEDSYLFVNACERCGQALVLRVLLPPAGEPASRTAALPGAAGDAMSGSPAAGAAVTVRLPDGRRLERQVDPGNGHTGVNPHEVHFGLGEVAAGEPLAVSLRWRGRAGAPLAHELRLAPGRWTVLLGGGG